MHSLSFRRVLIILFSTLLISCQPINKVVITGSYELERSEVEPYFYYLTNGDNDSAYGVLDSTVDKIGWNGNYIIVLQTSDGLKKGWRVIDINANEISGYLSDSEVSFKSNSNNISIIAVDSAWTLLKNPPNK